MPGPKKGGSTTSAVFAEVLRYALEQRGMKGKDLAERIGVSEVTVSRWLNGKMLPPPGRRRKIEKSLGLAEGYLDQTSTPQVEAELRSYAEKIEALESVGFTWNRTDYTQLGEDEVLELLVQDPRGFLRFLMSTYEQRATISLRAKLDYLDFIESIAKEKGVPIPSERLETYRQLVRQRHF